MPEGDTVSKVALFLDQALAGQLIRALRVHPAFGRSVGSARVERVAAQGKQLDIILADGRVLRSHLGLYGSWHRYRPGEAWHRPRRQASILLETADWNYVCFNAKQAEWLAQDGFRLRDQRHRLGADLIHEAIEPAELLGRARELLSPATLMVDVLLDQRLAAGIGNVYKSELLFLQHHAPLTPLGALSDQALIALYQQAAELLRANLGGGPRQTRFARDRRGGLWVYGRRDLPCLRCGTPIRRAILGAQPRSTYWCEQCQKPV
jgi:endonuclease-8